MMKHTITLITAMLLAPLVVLHATDAPKHDNNATPEKYSVASPSLTIGLTAAGEITGKFSGRTELAGSRVEGEVAAQKLDDGGYAFTRTLVDAAGHRCTMTDRFTPTPNSIRWNVEITAAGEFWTTPIEMRLQLPASEKTRFWTLWIGDEQWSDPLTLLPLTDATRDYGKGKNSICIPIASMLEPTTDTGVSLAVSPDQPLIWMQLSTTRDGTMLFRHNLLRLGGGKTVKFAADIVAHEADWRGGLRWMVGRYPEFFNPPNPRADAMAGTGSYSSRMEELTADETDRLKKMAYRTDWDASFNWPYFGIFMPPMSHAEATWQTYDYNSAGNHDQQRAVQMSYHKLNEKGRARKASGFFTLAYFNVTEFGVKIQGESAAKTELADSECWRDANTYLYRKIADGVYRNEKGKTAETWGGAIVTDSGGPDYQRCLLEQGRLLKFLPDFDGFAIDRMDWLPRVNFSPGADDHTGWYSGRPGRFLGLSWIDTLSKLGPILHRADKVIFVNCCMKAHRLDYMREVDGFYDEQGDFGYDLNGSCLLALRKPAVMWTHDAGWIKPDPDSYFQRHLHMGAYPTAPFPGNDHTILPDPKTDQYYLDYGPLLDAMRGKKWVLEPHCVESDIGKVNLFEVPGGYVLPVTLAGKADAVTVRVRSIPGLDKLKCVALHPGTDQAIQVAAETKDGITTLTVPVKRDCAMVRIMTK